MSTKAHGAACDLLVIGGGPAGLAAAVEAAGYGAKVTVADENARMGGQLIKQTHKFFGSVEHFAGMRGFSIAEELVRQAEELGVTLLTETRALGVLDDGSVALLDVSPRGSIGKTAAADDPAARQDDAQKPPPVQRGVTARTILLSVGARENALSFPGCTLPGVMGAGCAQTFSNLYGTLVGKKILMVGSGNVGLIVSYQLMQAGAEIVGIVEAAPSVGGYEVHAAKVRRAGVPIWLSHTVEACLGTERVEAAVIARVDGQFRPVKGSERRIGCDTVLLGVGLTPRTELASMLNVPMEYVGRLGGRIPKHDGGMCTEIPGVFVAGDAAGVEEASIALVEGRLAGYHAAEACGFAVPSGRGEELAADLARLRAVGKPAISADASAGVPAGCDAELPPIDDALRQRIEEADPVVCRCEEIRRSEILEAIAAGCTSVNAVKRYTRAGMGSCQGRTCGRMIERMLREAGVLDAAPGKARYPVVPCMLTDLEVPR